MCFGVGVSPSSTGVVFGIGFERLPCSLLLIVLAFAMIRSDDSVAERKLKILVHNCFKGAKAVWRSEVAVSKVFLAVATLAISEPAVVSRVSKEVICNVVLEGL